MFSLELGTETSAVCDCCGGTTTTLSRFVYRDERAFAVYFARFSDNHPHDAVAVLVSIGGWGTDDPSAPHELEAA